PAAPLPLEPEHPFEDDALKEAVSRRAGAPGAYLVNADDFDVAVITPVLLYGSRHRGDRAPGRAQRPSGNRDQIMKSMRPLHDFANWDDYVGGYPPVVMIRATPKRARAGFASMRLYCGDEA